MHKKILQGLRYIGMRLLDYALWIVLFALTYYSSQYIYREYYWFDGLFAALEKQHVKTFRLFQVWVAPFPPERPVSWIGGDLERFELWKKAVEDLCVSAKSYQKKIDFHYQIIVDQKVLEKHADLKNQWANIYGDMVEWVLLEDLSFAENKSIQSGLAQCYTGVASVCSDFLRFTQLAPEKFDRDCYMDIDSLSQAYANRHTITSAEALGGKAQGPGIYHTFKSINYHIGFNCDLLIANFLPLEAKKSLYADMVGVLEEYEPLYAHMASQQKRRELDSLEDYLRTIQPMVEWGVDHPNLNINQYGLILNGIGPGFWLNQLQKGSSLPYRYGFTEGMKNYFSWRDKKAYLPYHEQTHDLFEAVYDEFTAIRMLEINLCLYDYEVFAKDPSHPWAKELKAHCLRMWEEVRPHLKHTYTYGDQKIAIMLEQMEWDIL